MSDRSTSGIEQPHHPRDESPKLMYCHRCVGDVLASWHNGLWTCDNCGRVL